MTLVPALKEQCPANPPLIIFDTDALVQLLLVDQYAPLHDLRRRYGIQPAIVEAVEIETRSPGRSLKKHLSTLMPRLQKALQKGTLLVLDARSLPSIVGPTAHAVETNIAILGTRFHDFADYGEAYSHAAAVTLCVPLVTQDMTAVRALKRAGETLGPHILRVFDLYALSHQRGELSTQQCDGARQTLNRSGEWIPDAFRKHSFQEGMTNFYPRLLDRDLPQIGSSIALEEYDSRLVIASKVSF